VAGWIPCPEMLLIGAAHRHAGKTEFACRVIGRLAPQRPIIGIKVTSVDRDDPSSGPQAAAGDGRAVPLPAYRIDEERRLTGDKDTSRMLRAGAAQVLWLRVDRRQLAAGVAEVLQRVPAGALIVCESNAVREVVEPGLFLVVRRLDDPTCKPSYARVVDRADRVITFLGDGWDLAPERVTVAGNRWGLDPEARV